MAANAESLGALKMDTSSLCIVGQDAFIEAILVPGSGDVLEGVGGTVEARFTYTTPMEPNSGFGIELFTDDGGIEVDISATASGTITVNFDTEGVVIGAVESEEDITAGMSGVIDVTLRLAAAPAGTVLASIDFGSDGNFDFDLAGTALLTPGAGYQGGVFAGTCAVWCDEGHGLAGVGGVPELDGEGTLATGSPGELNLTLAATAKPAMLFVSFTGVGAPFKCGVLVPVPINARFSFFTNGAGSIPLSWTAWPGGLSGASVYFQYAIQDAAAVCGVALSNALRADVP